MERKVTKLEHSHVEVVVTVDQKAWKDAQKKAFNKLAANVTVDGFRKGKAPLNLVKGRVDPYKVFDNAINGLLPEIYRDIVVEENIKPFAQPRFDVVKCSEDELEVKATIVTMPEVEVGAYTGYKIGKGEATVSDDDVNAAIEDLRKQNAVLTVKEGKAEKGDVVVIDFLGKVDDVPFEGGEAENYELELGSGSFVPGFEDQLVGAASGDKVDVKIKFADNYGPKEIAGKDAVFNVTVHEVKAKSLPEVDEDFVKELKLPNVNTVEEFRASKAEELKQRKTAQLKNEYMGKLYDEIIKVSKFDIPEEVLDDEVNHRKQDMENRLAQSGITLEQYFQFTNTKEEDYLAQLRKDGEHGVKVFLVMNAVGTKENISLTEEEFELELAKIADQYNMKVEDVKKALDKQLDQFRNNIRMTNIENFLYSKND